MSDLLDLLLEAGLLLFGWFPRNGRNEPVQFHLDLLASYPDVLRRAASDLARKLPPAERLLCAVDSLPLGTALALELGIPLVYSRGDGRDPAYDIVGAYDIGHPTVLVSNVAGLTRSTRLLAAAGQVGLEVIGAAGVFAVGSLEAKSLPTAALFRLDEMADALSARGVLPTGQAAAVRAWAAERSEF